MASFVRLILVTLFFLSGTSIANEAPVTDSVLTDSTDSIPTNSNQAASGFHWQILPGEDVQQIVHLMFPKDSLARDNLMHAIIRTNPEYFPNGTYQPLPAGTTIIIPDLRTIRGKAKPVPQPLQISSSIKPQKIQPDADINPLIQQLIDKIQQLAEQETLAINQLIQRIESLEQRWSEIHALVLKRQAQARIDAGHESKSQENIVSTSNSPAIIQATDELPPDSHFILIAGSLLSVVIVILIGLAYRKIGLKRTELNNDLMTSSKVILQTIENPISNQDRPVTGQQNQVFSQMVSHARNLAQQGRSVEAAQYLQQHLSMHQFDIQGWLFLFELLYQLNNKADFKKNARRFKRLGIYPGSWGQIQAKGHQLEPEEPLYFDEQKRKEKFFPDS